MFIFKIEGINFDAKCLCEPGKLANKNLRIEKYKSGNAVGYEIVCSDGSFKINKWCLQSCDDLNASGTYPLVDYFKGMISINTI